MLGMTLKVKKKFEKRETVERGYLELAEIQRLSNTPSDRPEIKRAFLFSCFTGLRQSDVPNVTWRDIKDNKIIIRTNRKQRAAIL